MFPRITGGVAAARRASRYARDDVVEERRFRFLPLGVARCAFARAGGPRRSPRQQPRGGVGSWGDPAMTNGSPATLMDWLADTHAISRWTDRQIAARAAINASGWQRDLRADLDQVPDADPEAVAAIARRYIGDEDLVVGFLNESLQALAEDHFYQPPYRFVGNEWYEGILLFEHRLLSLKLGYFSSDREQELSRRPVTFSASRSLYRFIGEARATLGTWRAVQEPAVLPATEGHAKVVLLDEAAIQSGRLYEADGLEAVYRPTSLSALLVFLHADVTAGGGEFRRDFDPETGSLLRTATSDDTVIRFQLITTALSRFGRLREGGATENALAHSNYLVRWHVLRETLVSDPDAGIELLRKHATDDPHPTLRALAAAALSRIPIEYEA
jgi:hypothetical protein